MQGRWYPHGFALFCRGSWQAHFGGWRPMTGRWAAGILGICIFFWVRDLHIEVQKLTSIIFSSNNLISDPTFLSKFWSFFAATNTCIRSPLCPFMLPHIWKAGPKRPSTSNRSFCWKFHCLYLLSKEGDSSYHGRVLGIRTSMEQIGPGWKCPWTKWSKRIGKIPAAEVGLQSRRRCTAPTFGESHRAYVPNRSHSFDRFEKCIPIYCQSYSHFFTAWPMSRV